MNVAFRLLAFCMLWGLSVSAQEADTLLNPADWKPFVSLSGGFQVLSPAPLLERADTTWTDMGQMVYHTLVYQAEPQRGWTGDVYMVSFHDFPAHTFPPDSTALISSFFEETVAASAMSVKGEVVYQAEDRLQGFPGHIWRIHSTRPKLVIKTRAFLVEDRYYAVQTVRYDRDEVDRASDTFLNSFRLLR